MRTSRMRLWAMSTSTPNTVICATLSSGSCGVREMSTMRPEYMLTRMQDIHARLISAGRPTRCMTGPRGMER